MSKSLDEIAKSFESDESYEKAYRRIGKKHEFVQDLLMEGYDELAKAVKFRSDTNDYLSFRKAAQAMDKVVLTIATIFDEYIKCSQNSAS